MKILYRTSLVLSLVLPLLLATDLSVASGSGGSAPAKVLAQKPNILFILTDDLDSTSLQYMPKLNALITQQGTYFTNYFVTNSLCCPSRSSTLRGQYTHSTQILNNLFPNGGFQKFYTLGEERSTIATWLKGVGYNTALFGKYLNQYPDKDYGGYTYIPPGWTEWYAGMYDAPYQEFNYSLNENGRVVAYGSSANSYLTDVISRKANDFIGRSIQAGKPFFAWVATYAPHNPAVPAPRHANLFPGLQAPRYPSYNQADVHLLPPSMQRPPLTDTQMADIDSLYRLKMQSVQAIDEMIASLTATLQNLGQLDNTYIIFASDNGYHFGLHRLAQGKETAYEEDIKVPLIVRGPGVPVGQSDVLVANVDLAPTFAKIGSASPRAFVEGRSTTGLYGGAATSWRLQLLQEHYCPTCSSLNATSGGIITSADGDLYMDKSVSLASSTSGSSLDQGYIPSHGGLRTVAQNGSPPYSYVEYADGYELYDLAADPYEINNIYSTVDPSILTRLHNKLSKLLACSGSGCRDEESQPY